MTVDRGRCTPSAWLRAARCRKPTSIAGKHGRSQRRCARTPHPRCTASDKPYTAPVPTAPLESDHRDSNCGSPCEGRFVIVTFSPIAGASALNMAGPQWVYAIFHGWSLLSTMSPEQSRRVDDALDQLRALQRGRVLGEGSAAARVGSLVCLDRLVQQRNSQIKRLVRSDFDAIREPCRSSAQCRHEDSR
jgi:hypothetical protein